MLVNEFTETCQLYKDFQIWEIENMDAFFKGNEVLVKIFEDVYKITLSEFSEKRSLIPETDLDIMLNLLEMIDNKTFFVFTLHDKNHLELIQMQKMKVMNFGLDIQNISGDKVYVVIMDKKLAASFN